MAVLALVLIGLWLSVVAGLQPLLHIRRTGNAEVVRIRRRPGSAQWWTGVVSAVGLACAVAAPLAELLSWQPIAVLDRAPLRATGAVIVVVGIAASFGAQRAMGDSWRADADSAASGRAARWSLPCAEAQ